MLGILVSLDCSFINCVLAHFPKSERHVARQVFVFFHSVCYFLVDKHLAGQSRNHLLSAPILVISDNNIGLVLDAFKAPA